MAPFVGTIREGEVLSEKREGALKPPLGCTLLVLEQCQCASPCHVADQRQLSSAFLGFDSPAPHPAGSAPVLALVAAATVTCS